MLLVLILIEWLLVQVMDEIMKSHVEVFAHNIQTTMHRKGLRTLFWHHGDVIDAFISEKKSKSRRSLAL